MQKTGSIWAHSNFSWMGHALLTAMALVSISCGNTKKSNKSSTLQECQLASDQGGTLSGRWLKLTVPVAFQQGSFSGAEINAMVAAMKTWNGFFADSMGYPSIDFGSEGSPRTANDSLPVSADTYCRDDSLTIYNSATGSFVSNRYVIIYRDSTWPAAYAQQAIAITSTCRESSAGHKVPLFSKAFMELNYQYFFAVGRPRPDIQSIVLHELGHLLGLKHSCETASSGTGIPVCSTALPSDYLSASMYPTFSFSSNGTGESRRYLNDNDEGRMNCLYKDL